MLKLQSENGTVAADISRGAVQLLRGYTGRGPTKARTVISNDTVAIVLGDTLTPGEHRLVAAGDQAHVRHTRDMLQRLMRDDFVELVEKLSGRTVEAIFNDSHIDPDYAVEFFLLEPLPGTDGPEASPTQQAAGLSK
jgi:uncharacterized protein YbcI